MLGDDVVKSFIFYENGIEEEVVCINQKGMNLMIGILVGMGLRLILLFIDKVIDYCQKLYGVLNDIDYLYMMICLCLMFFYVDCLIDYGEMKRVIIDGVVKFEKIGVDFIVLFCNMVYVYYEEIQQVLLVFLLYIIEEMIKEILYFVKKGVVLGIDLII